MKNIEFRIYDKQEKKFLIKGEEVKRGDIKNLLCEIIDFDDFSIQIDNPDNDRYQFFQYAGIKDKNGVKIFEGDIIRDKSGRLYKVFWHGSFAGFCYEFKNELNKKDFKLLHLAYFNIEVIGNIYENPELLGDDE